MQSIIAVVRMPEGTTHLLSLRAGTPNDAMFLVEKWAPLLDGGPPRWLDRDWRWDCLDDLDELHIRKSPRWLVVIDDLTPEAPRDVLGVLVTTGPVNPCEAGLDEAIVGDEDLVWIENIAIAPSLRSDCPANDRREVCLKGIGPQLMLAAIKISESLGCSGRIGLHAEGVVAQGAYDKWGMQRLADALHRAGGRFPAYFGGREWAIDFRARK